MDKETKMIYSWQAMICTSFNVMGCSTNEYNLPWPMKIYNPVQISPVCREKKKKKKNIDSQDHVKLVLFLHLGSHIPILNSQAAA
jgi:hypothetical protein